MTLRTQGLPHMMQIICVKSVLSALLHSSLDGRWDVCPKIKAESVPAKLSDPVKLQGRKVSEASVC